MKVTVRLFASLRAGRFDESEMELAAGARVGDLVEALGLPPGEVAVVFVNSRHAEFARPIAEGDRVAFFPPVGGG